MKQGNHDTAIAASTRIAPALRCDKDPEGAHCPYTRHLCISLHSPPPQNNPATSQPSSDAVNAGAEDSEDEAVGGGKAGEPEDVTFSQADLSQAQGDYE